MEQTLNIHTDDLFAWQQVIAPSALGIVIDITSVDYATHSAVVTIRGDTAFIAPIIYEVGKRVGKQAEYTRTLVSQSLN